MKIVKITMCPYCPIKDCEHRQPCGTIPPECPLPSSDALHVLHVRPGYSQTKPVFDEIVWPEDGAYKKQGKK